jgi:TolA-binding protein
MRGFLFSVLLLLALYTACDRGVTQGGFREYFDRKPNVRGAARLIYYCGVFNDLMSREDVALLHYQSVVKHYPGCRWDEGARYGVGACLERLKRRPEAIAAYEDYVAHYPAGRFSKSVYNNIDYLKRM